MEQAIKGGCLLTLLAFMNIQCIWCVNEIGDATNRYVANRYVVDKSTKTGAEAYRLLENLPFEVNLTCIGCEFTIYSLLNICSGNLKKKKKKKIIGCEELSVQGLLS